VNERTVRHALLAPERSVKREGIVLEGEQIFQCEIDLIHVAGGDVILDPVERLPILIARPGQPQVGNLSALGGAMRVKPGARGCIVERLRRAKQPNPEQRNASAVGQQRGEFRLEAVAKLVGEEAYSVKSACKTDPDSIERGI